MNQGNLAESLGLRRDGREKLRRYQLEDKITYLFHVLGTVSHNQQGKNHQIPFVFHLRTISVCRAGRIARSGTSGSSKLENHSYLKSGKYDFVNFKAKMLCFFTLDSVVSPCQNYWILIC